MVKITADTIILSLGMLGGHNLDTYCMWYPYALPYFNSFQLFYNSKTLNMHIG